MSDIQLERINLNLLLTLDGLLQTQSVTETAKRLSVTPSAVSHNLRQLRELFDDRLLVRGKGGLTPTPRADAIREPLRRSLQGVQRALGATPFTPETARRRFFIAAPDFVGHWITTEIYRAVGQEWSGVDLDVIPSARAGNHWRLETGELAVAIGGLYPDAPGLVRRTLYNEVLVVVARADHPKIGETLDLETYGRLPHALVGLEDRYEPSNTLVDLRLRELGLTRRVALRQRSFFATLHAILESEMITTLPRTMALWAADRFDVRLFETPLKPIRYDEDLVWHERFDSDAEHLWLRQNILDAVGRMQSRFADRWPPRG